MSEPSFPGQQGLYPHPCCHLLCLQNGPYHHSLAPKKRGRFPPTKQRQGHGLTRIIRTSIAEGGNTEKIKDLFTTDSSSTHFFFFIIIALRAYGDRKDGFLRKIRSFIWQERIPQGTVLCHFSEPPPQKKTLYSQLHIGLMYGQPAHLPWPEPHVLIKNTPHAIKYVVYFHFSKHRVCRDTNKRIHCRCVRGYGLLSHHHHVPNSSHREPP